MNEMADLELVLKHLVGERNGWLSDRFFGLEMR
jgi:hypothetical protein